MKLIVSFILTIISLFSICFYPGNPHSAEAVYGYYTYYSYYYYYRSSYSSRQRTTYTVRLARYNRVYSYSSLTASHAMYYAMYYRQVRLSTYVGFYKWTRSRQCGNFEANTDNDYAGFYDCPLSFVPSNYTYCCGQKYAHYCCDDSALSDPFTSDPYNDGDAFPLSIWQISLITGACFCVLIIISVITRGVFVRPHRHNAVRDVSMRVNTVQLREAPKPPNYNTPSAAPPSYEETATQQNWSYPPQEAAYPTQAYPPSWPPAYPPPSYPVNDPAYPPPPTPSAPTAAPAQLSAANMAMSARPVSRAHDAPTNDTMAPVGE